MRYPSGFTINNVYSSIGTLTSVSHNQTSTKVFELPTYNQRGQMTSFKLGNGKTSTISYNNIGMPTNYSTPNVQDYDLSFNLTKGLLEYRRDNLKNKMEVFSYDAVNRLTSSTVQSTNSPESSLPIEIAYSGNGNIVSKSDIGDYTYDNSKIHAVVDVDNSSQEIPSFTQDIVYTSFDRVERISENNKVLNFTYDPELNRIKTQLLTSGSVTETKYFIGNYEKIITTSGTKEIHYIPTPNGVDAAYVIENGVGTFNYLYKDHLGSIVSVTNSTGTVVHEQNFDAWGKRRGVHWGGDAVPNPAYSWVRGFTGHEHLDDFGLINMNNRLYDPILGRMCAVDNFVQSPYFSQNYNRYSYVYNNPLSYTDPNGEFASVLWQVGWTIGGTIGNLMTGTPKPFLTALNNSRSSMKLINDASNTTFYSNSSTSITGSINYFGLGVSLNISQSIGDNYTVGASVGYGLLSGLFGSAFIGYNDGHTSFGLSGGIGQNYKAWSGNFAVDGFGLSYGRTYYGDAPGPTGESHKQIVGDVGVLFPGGSLHHQNDFSPMGDGGDRFRTAGISLQIGKYILGTTIITNSQKENGTIDFDGRNLAGQLNTSYKEERHGAWKNGQVYSSPLWLGISQGNFTSRIGYSHPLIQDKIQNNLHRNGPGFSRTNYFNKYDHFEKGMYFYSGYNNPFSLFE